MAGNIGIASPNDLNELFISVNTAWTAMDLTKSTLAETLSFYTTSPNSATLSLPLISSSSAPVNLPASMDRQFMDPQAFKQVITHNFKVPQQSFQVFKQQLLSDTYNLMALQNMAKSVLDGARQLWARELAKAINLNAVGFDGVSHINTAHPVNPLIPALGTYSNDVGAADLDEAGFASAMNLLENAPWFDGMIDGGRLRKVYVVVPNMSLFAKALKVVGVPAKGVGLAAVPGTAAGTSVAASSFMQYSGVDYEVEIIRMPILQSTIDGVAGSAKNWYVMNASDTMARPYVTSVVEQPVLQTEGFDPNDHIRVLKEAYRITWGAFGGCGNGLPREVVRATAP
jgi:hypothetical protein